MLTTIGLAIISISWVYMFYLLVHKGNTSVHFLFVTFYTIGVLLLVIDGFVLGNTSNAWLNFISLIFSAGVLVVLIQ